jgi:hypothetical protein
MGLVPMILFCCFFWICSVIHATSAETLPTTTAAIPNQKLPYPYQEVPSEKVQFISPRMIFDNTQKTPFNIMIAGPCDPSIAVFAAHKTCTFMLGALIRKTEDVQQIIRHIKEKIPEEALSGLRMRLFTRMLTVNEQDCQQRKNNFKYMKDFFVTYLKLERNAIPADMWKEGQEGEFTCASLTIGMNGDDLFDAAGHIKLFTTTPPPLTDRQYRCNAGEERNISNRAYMMQKLINTLDTKEWRTHLREDAPWLQPGPQATDVKQLLLQELTLYAGQVQDRSLEAYITYLQHWLNGQNKGYSTLPPELVLDKQGQEHKKEGILNHCKDRAQRLIAGNPQKTQERVVSANDVQIRHDLGVLTLIVQIEAARLHDDQRKVTSLLKQLEQQLRHQPLSATINMLWPWVNLLQNKMDFVPDDLLRLKRIETYITSPSMGFMPYAKHVLVNKIPFAVYGTVLWCAAVYVYCLCYLKWLKIQEEN